jgi:hypothetical protein
MTKMSQTRTDAFVCSLADLYGRGYSDAPQIPYDTALYVTQLALLMQHVKWDKAILCGLSMVWAHSIKYTICFAYSRKTRLLNREERFRRHSITISRNSSMTGSCLFPLLDSSGPKICQGRPSLWLRRWYRRWPVLCQSW